MESTYAQNIQDANASVLFEDRVHPVYFAHRLPLQLNKRK